MTFYGFEYFCGANVVVSVGDMALLEAAGISYSARDSKMPLYGYSSRHYDAVADGQVIVQGSLLVNFIHQDYLFRAIEIGTGQAELPSVTPNDRLSAEQVKDMQSLGANYPGAQALLALQQRRSIWDDIVDDSVSSPIIKSAFNPFDIAGGINITIAFGSQEQQQPYGTTAIRLVDVHFTGRTTAIRIDEDVVVESYDFFARDVFSLKNPSPIPPTDGEQ